ncbi:MAG: sigma-70 family RNA polymerase sigma factor [Limnobacter sp.]|nr:sigma-70 family RNA polymerase sigma factor [Limnobacter sp.]
METLSRKEELIELIGAVAKRDRSSFERLYQLTSRKMFAVALRIVRDQGMAQDVLQDAYIRLWRYAGTFNGKLSAPETWIHQIVRNRALDLISQQSNNVTSIPIDEFAEDGGLGQDMSEPLRTNDEKANAENTMRTCLEKLDGKYRQVLTLAYNYGMSHAEIATHIEVPLGTVKTWARRGLLELRTIYEEMESGAHSASETSAPAYAAKSRSERALGGQIA